MLPANLLFTPLDATQSAKKLIRLNKKRLSLLEKSGLPVTTKVDILRLLLQSCWLMEVRDDEVDIKTVLRELEIPTSTSSRGIIAGATVAMLEYITLHANELGDLEYGILRGYPRSSALAMVGLIPLRDMYPKNASDIIDYYLRCIYSQELYEEEREYYTDEWSLIERMSPVIYSEALKLFEQEL